MQNLITEYSIDEDTQIEQSESADEPLAPSNIQDDRDGLGDSNLKKLLDKLDTQNGISMPESTFLREDMRGFRELNEDFAASRVEEGPSCCAHSTLFDRVPTQLLAFSFMIFIGILGRFRCFGFDVVSFADALVGGLSVGADILIYFIQRIDDRLCVYIENNLIANYALHFLYMFFLLLTASVITQFIGPNAKGLFNSK
jgi:hypothetical protein